MQIDFHHAVTYVCARFAGFDPGDAAIVAHCAQYVDDATEDKVIDFTWGERYSYISSAHGMLDLQNMDYTNGLKVWQPFHFLAGNGDPSKFVDPSGRFVEKLVCLPDSEVAQRMVTAAFADIGKPRALHRLGVAMHVYADTWAHQGFVGTMHSINDVKDVDAPGLSPAEQIAAQAATLLPPIGHGKAWVLPDMPFLQWSYTNGLGKRVQRDNTAFFLDAANHLCQWMQRFLARDPQAQVSGIDSANMAALHKMFSETRSTDGDERHRVWLAAIADGRTFVVDGKGMAESPAYVASGPNSWKAQALGTDQEKDTYDITNFPDSQWKRFHDATLAHRFAVMHDILPDYGIFVG